MQVAVFLVLGQVRGSALTADCVAAEGRVQEHRVRGKRMGALGGCIAAGVIQQLRRQSRVQDLRVDFGLVGLHLF